MPADFLTGVPLDVKVRACAPLRETIFGAMALMRIASQEVLPPGRLLERQAAGRTLAVWRPRRHDPCLPQALPAPRRATGSGNLSGGRIVCPWHAWEFSVEDGALDFNPEVRLQRCGVEVRGGEVLVEIP